jgi:uncharacterized membrane protein YeiH
MGIISFTLSGFYIATKKELDLLGVCISAWLTALGGGIMRDIIVGVYPISLSSTWPMVLVLVVVGLLIAFKFHKKSTHERKPFFVFVDAIGLVSFSIAGALIAVEHNFAISGVIILAFITAIGGGVFRDVLLNVVPYVLIGGFYGVISVIIAVVVYILSLYGHIGPISLMILFVLAVSLRIIAFQKSWKLPTLK